MAILRLSDDISCSIGENHWQLTDTRNFRIVQNDVLSFAVPSHQEEQPGGLPSYDHVLAYFLPHIHTSEVVIKSSPTEYSDAIKPMESGTVWRGDVTLEPDIQEAWQLIAVPDEHKIIWTRSTRTGNSHKAITVVVPRGSAGLQLWHTGTACQLINEAIPGVGEDNGDGVESPDESEVLFYSVNSDNCLLMQFSVPGKITIRKTARPVTPVVGTPPWEIDGSGYFNALAWELTWEAASAVASEELVVTIYHGLTACSRHFRGRKQLTIPNVSADFGDFFYAMFLGGLQLNLRHFGDGHLAPRCNVIMGYVDAYKDAWTRDAVWGYLFYSYVDPQGVAQLMEDYIHLLSSSMPAYDGNSAMTHSPALGMVQRPITIEGRPQTNYWDDAAPEILMLAGRHWQITGRLDLAKQHAAFFERCADYILQLIPAGDNLPVTHNSWDAQGAIMGKEPYFVAECYAGLRALAQIEHALGNSLAATKYEQASLAMKMQALTDYREGGLWNADRGTFINFIDYRDPQLTSPRLQNWAHGELQASGVVRTEYAHYETIVPIWLGLLDDETQIRTAFSWTDANYTYATGRGGVTFPPFVSQNFIALLDVVTRLKYQIPGAERLLQLILDHALDGGIPISETAFGAYRGSGPMHPDWLYKFYANTHTGRTWDNAPYFGAVMQMHYGLDYNQDGWLIQDPRPIANYPISHVRDLCHHQARYNIHWQGTGSVQNIYVDDQVWQGNRLHLTEGEHEVLVCLAPESGK